MHFGAFMFVEVFESANLHSLNSGPHFIGAGLDELCVAAMSGGHTTLVKVLEQDLSLFQSE